MPIMTGAEMVIEALKKEGVTHIFAYQGGAVIPIFDALWKQDDVKVIIPRHEQGAGHAADGYARATGKVGVCLATSGPGATNLVTAIATAYMDSIPMVAITGQVASHLIGNDAFQEADMTGITRPITKHNFLIKSIEELPRVFKEAFYLARTGRPGPVLIDLPQNVAKASAELSYPETIEMRSYKPVVQPDEESLRAAITLIRNAERPLVYSGGGVMLANADKELRAFIDKTGIPITTTLLGLGTYPTTADLFVGMLGMHGLAAANYSVTHCDVLIAIGSRFDDRVTGRIDAFAPNAKIIHVDIDPTSVSKNVPVDIAVVGDAKNALTEFIQHLDALDIEPWRNQIRKWKKENPLQFEDDGECIKPQYAIRLLREVAGDDAIIATEVGQHQMWTAQHYAFTKPRKLLTSGGLGTMGYGLPAAIGAQVGNPNALVIDIAGDGSIQMNSQEFATASIYCLPVKVVILNNMYLGMVRQWQDLFYGKNYAGSCLALEEQCPERCHAPKAECEKHYIPDFVALGAAYGIKAAVVSKKEDLKNAYRAMIAHKGAYILDVRIAREENVFPMVPAGEAISRMLS